MKFAIITGMSGAGKSTVLRVLEDSGYYCVDNIPVQLIDDFADLSYEKSANGRNVAMSVDIRSGEMLAELENILDTMKRKGHNYEILFLDASDETIIKRFKETRRAHPVAPNGRVDEGIKTERGKLEFLKKRADYLIDTSYMLTKDLKAEVDKIFNKDLKYKNLYINVMSFGFKYGIPVEADLVFDVRFMPNPFYVPELKPRTGNEKVVRDYVMNSDVSRNFVDKLLDMITFLVPNYVAEGKNQLVIAIGCTGGKHRSVTVANTLYETLYANDEYGVKIYHRDISK